MAGLGLATVAHAGFDLDLVATGFESPTVLAAAGDGSGRLFLAEQGGRVWVIDDGEVVAEPFLDISDRVRDGGGNGLLGLAFHPDFEDNGFVFANYVSLSGHTTIARYRVQNNNPNRARASSEALAVVFDLPAGNHKGGDIAFGPDGYLYLTMGDASSGGDPDDNAQNLGSPFGKILRYDVDTIPAVAPAGNPFFGVAGARDEIWAYGLRNPWRMSFDSATGDMFVADVGEDQAEEVNFQPAGSPGGENYGWRRKEGSFCFEPATGCEDVALTSPVVEYEHDVGCSITGGYGYRGSAAKTIAGHYLYGDFCSGNIWAAAPNANGVWVSRFLERSGLNIVTFGRDDAGELYVVDRTAGTVYKLVSRELLASGFETGTFAGWKRRGAVELIEPGLAPSGLGRSGFAASVVVVPGGDSAIKRKLGGERRLETSFVIELSGLDLDGDAADVATWRDGKTTLARVSAAQVAPKRFRIEIYATDTVLGERLVGSFKLARSRSVQIDLEWTAASALGSADGSVRLLKNLRRRGDLTDLSTGDLRMKALELGLPEGAPAGADGSVIVDEIVLSR